MSLQTTTNQLEKCHECQSNISTFFCKECKRNLFKQCWEIIHNMTTSHNINKSHLSPSQLVIPIKDILSIFLFNKVTKHDGQFRNGFLNPNDSPKIFSQPNGGYTKILCDKTYMDNLGSIIMEDIFSIHIIYIHIVKEIKLQVIGLKGLKDCKLMIK